MTEFLTVAVAVKSCQCFSDMSGVSSSTETVDLYPYGDRELWYAHGEGWSLPVFVLFHEDKTAGKHWALIEPCFGLYTSQQITVKRLFEAHDVLNSGVDRWLIMKQTCEALLRKAPGVTPERYYKWPDCKLRPMPAWKPVQYSPENPNGVGSNVPKEDERAFVKFVSESSGIQSSVVRIVLDAIADAALRWMLEKRKAVDLGFCRIIAAPFRANWKEIIAFKLGAKKLLSLFSQHHDGELLKEFEKVGLPEVMTSPHNIGLRDRRVDYVMEVTPTPRFEKFVKEFSARIVARGHTSHVQHYEQMVESLYRELVASLRYYIKKVSAPFARVCEGGSSGIVSLQPAQRSRFKSRRLPLAHLPKRIIPTASPFSVWAEQDRLNAVQKTANALPEVSTVPSEDVDVWRPNLASDVECFPGRDDEEGAIGLHVCDVDKIETAGQPMLSSPETGATTPRLDSKGD